MTSYLTTKHSKFFSIGAYLLHMILKLKNCHFSVQK